METTDDQTLLWGHFIFIGNVTKASKRSQIEVTVDGGSKVVCPIQREEAGRLQAQSRVLAFRLSSAVNIEVVRKSRLPGVKHSEGRCSGSVADFIKHVDRKFTLNGTNGVVTVKIFLSNDYANTIMKGVDESLGALNTSPVLGQASDAIDMATNAGANLYGASKALGDVITPLGQALQLMVKIGDSLADAHPILKASWVVLSSVYKAVQNQKTQDDAVRDLADSLREMLGAANACPDLREIENTTRVSESIGLAALEIASLIEECTKYASLPARVAQSQFKDLAPRVTQCKQQCNGLLEKFDRRIHLQNHADLKEVKHTLDVELETKQKEDIYNWLAAPDPSLNYIAAREKHCEGTGKWFLNSDEYKKWKSESDVPLFMWGAPGFGKTILCSTVIQDIIKHCGITGVKTACTYFIFDGRNLQANFQQHRKSIRSLIKQLSYRYPSFPLPLKDLYGDGTQQPTLTNLEETFLQMTAEFDDVYVIIDSLDECTEWSHLFKWIKGLSQNRTGRLHFFATSRPEYDIKEDLKGVPCVDFTLREDLVSSDLGTYIEQMVQSNRKLSKLTAKLDVSTTVTTNASGMFTLVALRLDQLQQCLSEADVQEQLADLPNDLDEMYCRMISKLQPAYQQRVLLIMQWLAFSMRSISLGEIAEVVAVEFAGDTEAHALQDALPRFNPKRRFDDTNDVLGICGGLVNVTQFGEIQLSHLSVREYLLSPRRQLESSRFYFNVTLAHSAIAKTCIAYLLQFTDGIPHGDVHRQYPLASYSAQFWHSHIRCADEDSRLEDETLHQLAMEFLLSSYAFQASTIIHNPHFEFYHFQNYPDASPLYFSSLLGLRSATADLLERGMDPTKEETEFSGNILIAASIRGNADIIRMLVDGGADPNGGAGKTASPLLAAVTWGRPAAVKMLLERGADPNICESDKNASTPLQIAALAGRIEIVKDLLEHGADINKGDAGNANALENTCVFGYINLVQFLLDSGANPNHGGEARALQAAAYNGHSATVELLLAHGADPTLPGGYGNLGTAMQAAAVNGRVSIVEMLLKAGGSLNAEGGKYGGVVQAASAGGHSELVEFLLDNGADPNLTGGGEFEHALVTATARGKVRTVELLMRKGISPNIPGTRYALQIASANGNANIVKLLLEHGAEPNVTGGWYGSALQAAINGGFVEVVQLLLRYNSNPNVYGSESSSPLYRAAEDGYLSIVRLLLDHGADPVKSKGRYKTALHVACNNGYKNIVKLLLDRGTNPNMPGAQGHGNPIHIASTNGHGAIVRILLANGADLNAEGAKYAITVASAEGYLDIVELLLEGGADLNVSGGWYGTPLQAAALNGYLPIVDLLLEKGADVNAQAGHHGTALLAALHSGHMHIVQVLLQKSANPNTIGKSNSLELAATNGNLQVATFLLDHGMNPNEVGRTGRSPLQAAAKGGHLEVVKLLLEHGADPNFRTNNQATALELSSLGGHTLIVILLLDGGGDPHVVGPEGGPLQAAVISGNEELIGLLLEQGLDPETTGGRYGTAVNAAAALGNQEVIGLLRQRGYEVLMAEDTGGKDNGPVCNTLVVSPQPVDPFWNKANGGYGSV